MLGQKPNAAPPVLGRGVHSLVEMFFSAVIGIRKLFLMTVRLVVIVVVVEILIRFSSS